ncbi:EAL domain-containing protein [Euzebya sp.]|uniref:EAL domain-containing protein n=1 Tax=Euzebya sp. TaxID=1971409 RepID=UPI0035156E19
MIHTSTAPSRADLLAVLADPTQPSLVAQPIVDLVRGSVVGYEVLSRFGGPPPDAWFAAALSEGLSGALQAHVVAQALRLRALLPPNTFLTVNVDPNDLMGDEVAAVLAAAPARLDRIVLELTEHTRIGDLPALRAVLEGLRRRGAMVAVDDVGSGYSGLQALLALRPQIVKADRSLVDRLDAEPAQQAVLSMLGQLAGRMDAWLLAEGIERPEELVELIRLDVPLGQGYLLARPAADLVREIPAALCDVVRDTATRLHLGDVVVSLVDTVPLVHAEDEVPPGVEVAVRVDPLGRPRAVRWHGYWTDGPLLVKGSEALRDVGLRMADRTGHDALTPAVVVDGRGCATGVLRAERLLRRLALGH